MKAKDIYFQDHTPGSPARIRVGNAGATVYGLDGAVVATFGTIVMDRIVRAWTERQPAPLYHFIGAEADKCG